MRISCAVLLLVALTLAGCAGRKSGASEKPSGQAQAPAAAGSPAPLATPAARTAGKVAAFNDAGRFVVLEFPVGHMPALEQRLFVYRNGLKVGEIKVSGPQRGDHIVADLTAGEARSGDEVRDK